MATRIALIQKNTHRVRACVRAKWCVHLLSSSNCQIVVVVLEKRHSCSCVLSVTLITNEMSLSLTCDF